MSNPGSLDNGLDNYEVQLQSASTVSMLGLFPDYIVQTGGLLTERGAVGTRQTESLTRHAALGNTNWVGSEAKALPSTGIIVAN